MCLLMQNLHKHASRRLSKFEAEKMWQCLHFAVKLPPIPSRMSHSLKSFGGLLSLIGNACVLSAESTIYCLKCTHIISNCQLVTAQQWGLNQTIDNGMQLQSMFKGLSMSLVAFVCTTFFKYAMDITHGSIYGN